MVEHLEDYPLVLDHRNYKSSKDGGKGCGPQGCILKKSIIKMTCGTITATESKRTYVVVMNVQRNARSIMNILTEVKQVLPPGEHHRLAAVLCINEKVTFDHPQLYQPKWRDILSQGDHKALHELGFPVLLLYCQWTAFRKSLKHIDYSPEQIREAIFSILSNSENKRQFDARIIALMKEDEKHTFPFGAMRTVVMFGDDTMDFINNLIRKKKNNPIYMHIQDSDFTCLKTKPQFYSCLRVPEGKDYLYHRYDDFFNQCECLPIIAGGAHVYDPDEEIEKYSIHCRGWTRFTSEIGNYMKQVIGKYQPYGLYFHEPNTMLLAPQCILSSSEIPACVKAVVKSHEKIQLTFGIDSEIQYLTRQLFKPCSDKECSKLMVFTAIPILATSMKRGKARPFAIKFSGTWNRDNNIFEDWTMKDIQHMHGMPQEILKADKWMNNVTTSFRGHLKKDSRAFISKLYHIFNLFCSLKVDECEFYSALLEYENRIKKRKKTLKQLFQSLLSCYGDNYICYCLVSLAWECGQVMRIMLLDHLKPPERLQGVQLDLNNVLSFIQYGLNNGIESHVPNFTIVHLLGKANPPKIPEDISYVIICQTFQDLFQNFTATDEILLSVFLKIKKNHIRINENCLIQLEKGNLPPHTCEEPICQQINYLFKFFYQGD